MEIKTLERAQNLVELYRTRLKALYDTTLDPPKILPGPNDGIDIHWDCPKYEILINIPLDPTAKIGFYCDDKKEISLKGKLNAHGFSSMLLLWMAYNQTR